VQADPPHLSTTAGFVGRLSVHAWNKCTIQLSHWVTAILKREKCYWIFCRWNEIAIASYANPLAFQATAKANSECSWKSGWYVGQGKHATMIAGNTVNSRTQTHAYKLWCW
jgi:hypothetical protein